MKRVILPLLLLSAAVPVFAQDTPTGLRVRVAYGFTPTFDANGDSHHFAGPEIAVAIPVGTAFGQDLLLEPSFFGGGRLQHGKDDDSDVYRLSLFLHHTFSGGVGFRAGVGYAGSSRARGGGFEGKNGAIFDFGVDIPFSYKKLDKIAPFVDLHGIVGTERQLSGFFAGVGVKF